MHRATSLSVTPDRPPIAHGGLRDPAAGAGAARTLDRTSALDRTHAPDRTHALDRTHAPDRTHVPDRASASDRARAYRKQHG